MAKRRSTRNKVREPLTENKAESRVFSVSHNVIIDNVCNKSLLDPSVKCALPSQLQSIYEKIMTDLPYINDIQSNKDCSFYHYNMAFWKAEETVCKKRKEVIELLMKNAKELDRRRVKTETVTDETEHKETNNKTGTKRPKRKRKIPSKFEELVTDDSPKIEDIQNTEEDLQVIDLCSDDSQTPKPKIYFREPSQRKIAVSNGVKKLKEHTLLDKIMLGINCVRQWTERGLQLTRIPEGELGLLNKRLSSIRCTMSDLTENTDENNNKSLSVLIQSDLFSNLNVNQPPSESPSLASESDSIQKPLPAPVVAQQPSSSPLVRHKQSKQHVTAVYRQRHNLPAILARPPPPQSEAPPLPAERLANSASQLLRLKSQRSHNGTATGTAVATEPKTPSVKREAYTAPALNVPCRPTLLYQTVPRSNFVLPLYISPLVPISQRPFRIPLGQPITGNDARSVTRYQPIQMRPAFVPSSVSAVSSRNDLCPGQAAASQSTILKNLLQQSSGRADHNGLRPLNSSRMVPLSVFQNNRNRWHPGPISQYTAKK